jgi:hypothetical protein
MLAGKVTPEGQRAGAVKIRVAAREARPVGPAEVGPRQDGLASLRRLDKWERVTPGVPVSMMVVSVALAE